MQMWIRLTIIVRAEVELVTGAIYVILTSKATLTGAKKRFFQALDVDQALNWNSGTVLVPVGLHGNNMAIQEPASAAFM